MIGNKKNIKRKNKAKLKLKMPKKDWKG